MPKKPQDAMKTRKRKENYRMSPGEEIILPELTDIPEGRKSLAESLFRTERYTAQWMKRDLPTIPKYIIVRF